MCMWAENAIMQVCHLCIDCTQITYLQPLIGKHELLSVFLTHTDGFNMPQKLTFYPITQRQINLVVPG